MPVYMSQVGMGGAVIAGFTPPTPTALLDAWFAYTGYLFQDTSCTTQVTAAGQSVKGIKGYTGTLGNLTQSTNAPLSALTTGIYGVTFNGSTNLMTLTFGADRSQPMTWYIVAKRDTPAGGSYMFDGVASGKRHSFAFDGPTPHYYSYSGNDLIGAGTVPSGINAAALVVNTTSSTIRGTSISESGNVGTMVSSGITLGARFSATQLYTGEIRALMCYAAAHTTGQQDTVLAWLRTQFGAN